MLGCSALSTVVAAAYVALCSAPAFAADPPPASEEAPPAEPTGATGATGASEPAPPAAEPTEGGAPPGAETAPPEGGTAETAEELVQALEATFLGDHAEAARLSWIAITKIKKGAEKYESAQFALAEALEQMGLQQAAAEYYFAVADQRQNPALLARALSALDRMARGNVLDEDKLLRGVLSEADLASVPPDVADFLHYYRGLSNLRLGYRRWADFDFTAIRRKSHYGREAALVAAVTKIKDGEIDKALEIIEEILSEDVKDRVTAEARLARARIFFEQNKQEQAIAEYKLLKSDSIAIGEALMERAWAHYRGGGFHDAMGLLYALGAPGFRDLYLPDQYVLRGLIYQRFCHFRAAKAAVADFRGRYGAAVKQIQAGIKPDTIPVIGTAALELEQVMPSKRVLDAVLNEKQVLDDRRGALDVGGLAAHLEGLYQLLEARATRMHRRTLEAGARVVAERLLEANEQANLLEYEVGVSIFRPVKQTVAGGRTPAEEVPSHGELLYYPFDEEYWSDELPMMRFLIQDRCVE